MRPENVNTLKIQELHADATQKLKEFRELLEASITKYKETLTYRRRDKKSKAQPNNPKHPRLLDVDALEKIVADPLNRTTTDLAKKVEKYINNPKNFRFFAAFSPLRRGLNTSLKNYRKGHDLKAIDDLLQLYQNHNETGSESSLRESPNTDTASSINGDFETIDFSQESEERGESNNKQDIQIIARLNEAVNARDTIINQERRRANKLEKVLQKKSEAFEKTRETLVQTSTMLGQLQKHVLVKDEVIKQQEAVIAEKEASLKYLTESFKKYAKSAWDLVLSLTDILSGVTALLKISLPTLKGAKIRKEITKQLKDGQGNYYDLLVNQKDTEKGVDIYPLYESYIVEKTMLQEIVAQVDNSANSESHYQKVLADLPKVDLTSAPEIPSFSDDSVSFDVSASGSQPRSGISAADPTSLLPPPLPPYEEEETIIFKAPQPTSGLIPPPPPPPPSAPVPPPVLRSSPTKLSSNSQGMLNQIGSVSLKTAKTAMQEPVTQAPTASDLLSQLKRGVSLRKAPVVPKVVPENIQSELFNAFKVKFQNARPEDEDDDFKPWV